MPGGFAGSDRGRSAYRDHHHRSHSVGFPEEPYFAEQRHSGFHRSRNGSPYPGTTMNPAHHIRGYAGHRDPYGAEFAGQEPYGEDGYESDGYGSAGEYYQSRPSAFGHHSQGHHHGGGMSEYGAGFPGAGYPGSHGGGAPMIPMGGMPGAPLSAMGHHGGMGMAGQMYGGQMLPHHQPGMVPSYAGSAPAFGAQSFVQPQMMAQPMYGSQFPVQQQLPMMQPSGMFMPSGMGVYGQQPQQPQVIVVKSHRSKKKKHRHHKRRGSY